MKRSSSRRRKALELERVKRRKAVERNESYQMLAANQLTADQLATLQGSDALSAKKQQQFKPKPIKPSEDASSHHGLMSSLADDLETDELDESESFETSDEEEAQEQQPSAPSSSSSSFTSTLPSTLPVKKSKYASLPLPADIERFPLTHIPIKRLRSIAVQRGALPILMEEQPIVEAVLHHPVVIICGETGSGKTSQVPQFLYEAGYANRGMIGVTQPRRVAAISVATRVNEEMNCKFGEEVAYQVRYDLNVSDSTRIKFMTDGVLLKEVQADFVLKKYSVIVLDEAHERNINTDILIGLLSRIVLIRLELSTAPGTQLPPLKLVIMSATLRVQDFTSNQRLFATPPPVLEIPARQFPVVVHFSKLTPPDHVDAAFRKALNVHKKLPPGGILVFLTGQDEIEHMVDMLRDASSSSALSAPLHILPLYAMLPTERQLEVFNPHPEGSRLVVVATNVAETSLTIPGITYVIDSGKHKERVWDIRSGLATFEIQWVSKASADQRSGRAGRTGPGHTYRLYSSAVYNDTFPEHSTPEIQKTPIEGIVLQMKSMGIEAVSTFPFPTPPNFSSLAHALETLSYLGALEEVSSGAASVSPSLFSSSSSSSDSHRERSSAIRREANLKITDLGSLMGVFPVTPRYAKMLVAGSQGGCLPYVIAIVAALSVRSPFLGDVPALFRHPSSDIFTLLRAIGAFEYSGGTESFSAQHSLHHKSMQEIRKLRHQLTDMVNAFQPPNLPAVVLDPQLKPPSSAQELLLRQIVTSGFIDQVARLDRGYAPPAKRDEEGRPYPKLRYQTCTTQLPVYVHSRSVLASGLAKSADTAPEYLVYHELMHTTRDYITGLTVAKPTWLSKATKALVSFAEPQEDPLPRYHAASDSILAFARPSFGPFRWDLPPVEIELVGSRVYFYFVHALLKGEVVPSFRALLPHISANPDILIRTQSNRHLSKISALLNPISSLKVSSKKAFLECLPELKKQRFLSGLLLWYNADKHPLVIQAWNELFKTAPK